MINDIFKIKENTLTACRGSENTVSKTYNSMNINGKNLKFKVIDCIIFHKELF